jgi:cardiolipin synthase
LAKTNQLEGVNLPVISKRQTLEMPDGRGKALNVLDRAAACGIDVRLIFGGRDSHTEWLKRNAFWGSAAQIGLLKEHRSGVKICWDRAHPGFCLHQKSWLMDAGAEA